MTETAESSTTAAPRRLRFHVLRHDPRDPQSVAHTELFELEEAAGMTLFIALNEIREQLDASLASRGDLPRTRDARGREHHRPRGRE